MRTTGEGGWREKKRRSKGCSGMRYSTFSRATSVGVIGSGIEGCDSCNLFPPPLDIQIDKPKGGGAASFISTRSPSLSPTPNSPTPPKSSMTLFHLLSSRVHHWGLLKIWRGGTEWGWSCMSRKMDSQVESV
ncbi:hypothetical protein CEXT_235081 [Caerostris extrusa]|uniref:Uncharacterized protein n=1 Tax=Caerostris extrusa TaxID=172846 RepID=A0AAV4XS36_CAEEX|nr:hypothetical protein CEXT_235081 [Caerostris extrusa]